MNQYLVTAYDFTDTEAFERRTNVRPHHLDAVRELKEKGNYVLGGAMLNADGKMDAILARVAGAGGAVVLPRTSIGQHGFIALIKDTEGNRVGLHSGT